MLSRKFRILAPLVLTAVGLLTPHVVHATAIANSVISFSNLQITPVSGSVDFSDFWTAEAFAQAQNSLGELASQFDLNSGGNAVANATVTFALGHGDASGAALGATASSSVNIPGPTTAQASSTGLGPFGRLSNVFMITSGTGDVGDVQVTFSVDLTGNLNVLTDSSGQLAETETIFDLALFDLALDDDTIFFRDDILSIGPSAFASMPFSQTLKDSRMLQFGTPYFVLAEVDSESQAINIPEPSTVVLMLAGLIALASFIRRKT